MDIPSTIVLVGDIFVSCFTWDGLTTNHFYQVISITPKGARVRVREIGTHIVGDGNPTSGYEMAVPGNFIGPERSCYLSFNDRNEPYIHPTTYRTALKLEDPTCPLFFCRR